LAAAAVHEIHRRDAALVASGFQSRNAAAASGPIHIAARTAGVSASAEARRANQKLAARRLVKVS